MENQDVSSSSGGGVSDRLTQEEKEIRKLRKKLRQIEGLELLDRDLNEEELIKVKSKTSIRKQLRSLVTIFNPDEEDLMKRQGPSQNDEVVSKKSKSSKEEISSTVQEENQQNNYAEADSPLPIETEDAPEERVTLSIAQSTSDELTEVTHESSPKQENIIDETKKPVEIKTTASSIKVDVNVADKTKSEKSLWRDSRYEVYTLEGHNDLVLSVDCDGDYIISASRDTTVKVWRVGETTENGSLRGHTSSVTAAVFLPEKVATSVLRKFEEDPESFPSVNGRISAECMVLAISGSLDCTIRVWDIQSGESCGSIYTYNGITTMRCGDWGAVTGTEGGKLEVWCIAMGQRLAYVNGFEQPVAALHVDGNTIYAGSRIGEVGIWRFDPSKRVLNTIFVMEDDSQVFVPLRNLSTMIGFKGVSYFGDHGPNIKVMDWKKGNVSRLVNHIGDIGMTDSLALSSDGHILASSYYVDTGCSTINVREIASGKYVCSLIDREEGRFLAMCSAPGVLVTGGHLLKVWIQGERTKNVSKKKKTPQIQCELIHPNVLRKLSSKAVDSASEDDTDWASSSDEEELGLRGSNPEDGKPSPESGGGWWCRIL